MILSDNGDPAIQSDADLFAPEAEQERSEPMY